jgi:RimJ/RimL family protein N-acetyltransferase
VGFADMSLGIVSPLLQFDMLLTSRFYLKQISMNDVGVEYLSWIIKPQNSQFIYSVNKDMSIDELKEYVRCRIEREDILFLTIRDRVSGLHIGNIKYEPINFLENYAVMGILIGNKSWRGQGVAVEVLIATGNWLKEAIGIKRIILGVNSENLSAISAYKKIGFIECDNILTPQLNPSDISMTWEL